MRDLPAARAALRPGDGEALNGGESVTSYPVEIRDGDVLITLAPVPVAV